MKHGIFCVSSDDEPEALRKQSFFDGSILTSSNSLVVDRSVSVNGDKSALREETFCFEYDCFGDEEDAADMIGRFDTDKQDQFLSKYFYSGRKTNRPE